LTVAPLPLLPLAADVLVFVVLVVEAVGVDVAPLVEVLPSP
jgi:hypothetical protein